MVGEPWWRRTPKAFLARKVFPASYPGPSGSERGRLALDRLPVFIGEGDLCKYVDADSYKLHAIQKHGATHVHVRLNPDVYDRRAEVRDLLGRHTIAFEPYGCNPAMA